MAATESDQVYDTYLSDHYERVMDPRYRARKIAFIRHNYARYLPADQAARVLEIGPGYGELLEWLSKDLGFNNIEAMDLSKEVVDHCNRMIPGCAVQVSDPAEELRRRPGRYDRIFMLHVLEHVPKPEVLPFLTALRGALAPGGMLLIEVPNMGNPLTGLNMRYADFTHEVGFTDLSLHFALQKAGFSQVEVFDATLANDRLARPLQFLLQRAIRLGLVLVYRAWALRPPASTAPILCACATK